MPMQERIELKGVIPPKYDSREALLEAINELREFVRQFPGLGEEVIKAREQDHQNSPSSPAYRSRHEPFTYLHSYGGRPL